MTLGHNVTRKLQFSFHRIFESSPSVYLFEQRVSADFLNPDLPSVQLPHILIHDRLQVHGTIQTTLQFPEERH